MAVFAMQAGMAYGNSPRYNHLAFTQVKADQVSKQPAESAPPKHPPAVLASAPATPPYPPPPQSANTYARGNCTWYVASLRYVPNHWGNADHWLYAARAAGWTTGSAPRVGAIAWTSLGWAGHVAYVTAVRGGQVTVTEMNVLGLYRIDHRTVPASYFYYIY